MAYTIERKDSLDLIMLAVRLSLSHLAICLLRRKDSSVCVVEGTQIEASEIDLTRTNPVNQTCVMDFNYMYGNLVKTNSMNFHKNTFSNTAQL